MGKVIISGRIKTIVTGRGFPVAGEVDSWRYHPRLAMIVTRAIRSSEGGDYEITITKDQNVEEFSHKSIW